MLTKFGLEYQSKVLDSIIPNFIKELPDTPDKELLKTKYDHSSIVNFPCKWIFEKVNQLKPPIRYFHNFNLNKAISSLIVIFGYSYAAPDIVLDKSYEFFIKSTTNNILFEDLKLEPHYKTEHEKEHTPLLFLQLVDHLGTNEFFMTVTLLEIQNILFGMNRGCLDLHTGLIISEKHSLYRKYQKHNMCADNEVLIDTFNDLLNTIDKNLIKIISKTIFEAQQVKHYICLDTKEEINGVRLNTYKFKKEQLRICSNFETRFNIYNKYILEHIMDENFYFYKLGHILGKIKENITTKYGYFNLDTQRPNKTNANKQFCCEEYLLLSDDQSKLKWYSDACKKHQLTSAEARRSERLAEKLKDKAKAKDKVEWMMIKDSKNKRANIPQPVREQIWRREFKDKMDGICWCCDKAISFTSFYAGHIVSDHEGGQSIASNLLPICRSCNLSMGTNNLYEFVEKNDLPGKYKSKLK